MKQKIRKWANRAAKTLLIVGASLLLIAAVFVIRTALKPRLDDEIRKELGGSYIQLAQGVTHYEWNRMSDTAPLVVLIQGVTVPMMVYDRVVPALNEAGFSTLRFDFYGRGLSDRPFVTYNTALYAEQGMELIDKLEVSNRPLHIVAISLGGAVASRIVAERPRIAASVALIGPAVAFSEQSATDQKWNFIKERARIFEQDVPAAPDGPLSDPEIFKPHIKRQFEYAGVEWAFLSIGINENQYSYLEQYDRLAAIPGIPIAFIWGEKDNHFPLSDGRRLAQRFTGAEFHVIKGGGHTPHFGQSDLTNPVLIRFLKSVENSARRQ